MAAYQLDYKQTGTSSFAASSGPFSHTNSKAIAIGDLILIMVVQANRNADGALATPDFTGTTVAPTLLKEEATVDGHLRVGWWYVEAASAYGIGAFTTQVATATTSWSAFTTTFVRDASATAVTFARVKQAAKGKSLALTTDTLPTGLSALTACTNVGTSQTPAAGFDYASDGDLVFCAFGGHSGTLGATSTYLDDITNRDVTVSGRGQNGFGAGGTAQTIGILSGGVSLGDKTGATTPTPDILSFAGAQTDVAGVLFVVEATPIPDATETTGGSLDLRLLRLTHEDLPQVIHSRMLGRD